MTIRIRWSKLIGWTLIGGPGKFFDAPLLSFDDTDQGIKSSRNKWRTKVLLSELYVDHIPGFAAAERSLIYSFY